MNYCCFQLCLLTLPTSDLYSGIYSPLILLASVWEIVLQPKKSLRDTKFIVPWYLFTPHSWNTALGNHHLTPQNSIFCGSASSIQNATYAPKIKDPAGLDNI